MTSLRFFLIATFALSLSSAGYVDTIDSDASYYTSKAILERASLRAEPPIASRMIYAVRGNGCFTKMGLLIPVLYLPFVVAGKAATALSGIPETATAGFFISFFNALVTAGILTLLRLFFLRQGLSPRRALMLTALAGLATFLLPYAKTAHREPLQALITLAALVFIDRPWLLGLAVAAGLLTKLALLLPLSIPFAVGVRRGTWRTLTPIAIALAIWFLYAHFAFHGAFRTGYGPDVMSLKYGKAWATPFWRGIYSQLFDPNDGLLFYNPIFLLLLLVWRRLERIDYLALAVCAVQICLHAKWYSPNGDVALGPRYLVVIVPALCLLLRHLPSALPRPALAVIAWSLFVQLTATAVKIQEYNSLAVAAPQPIETPHWLANLKFFKHKLGGKPERYRLDEFAPVAMLDPDPDIDLTNNITLAGFNFWWLHAPRFFAERERKAALSEQTAKRARPAETVPRDTPPRSRAE